MSNPCIICNATDHRETVEHIIPQALGNEYYVLPRGVICFNCNNRIARVENRVVSSKLFMEERKKYGLIKNLENHHITKLNHDDLFYLVIKMGYEGLYKSQKKLWSKLEWSDVKKYLLQHRKYPGLNDRNHPDELKYKSIPGLIDRFRLRNHHLTLEYRLVRSVLYVRFQFGKIRVWSRMN